VVDNLASAIECFVELALELAKFHTPSDQGGNRHAPANMRARGAELVGELERYEDS
jgi:hypothetical protein